MILLFTDFGTTGPYVGQMRAVLAAAAPDVPTIDLMHDAPAFRPKESGYLLAALLGQAPADAVVLGVVDPGVGTDRRPVVLRIGTRWLVGPDNGLFAPAVRHANAAGDRVAAWSITWRPATLSASFHGRDLFAPVAAELAGGAPVRGEPVAPSTLVGVADGPDDLPAVVYLDGYGNAMTGLRAALLPSGVRIRVGGQTLCRAETFGSVPVGTAFWYVNSCGLVEIAVNRGSAAATLLAEIGTDLDLTMSSNVSGHRGSTP